MDSSKRMQRQDGQRLFAGFYAHFDHSLVVNFLKDYQKTGASAARNLFLGEGRHARAYLGKPPGQDGRPGLVVRLFREEAWAEEGEGQGRFAEWWSLLEKLARLRLSLVPPFELLRQDGCSALIAPYGEPYRADLLAVQWQPFTKALFAFEQELAAHKLRIDDQMQVWVWQGIPFVSDLSDLKRL